MTAGNARILFVDDENVIIKGLQKLLSDEQWQCHYVNSADEALAFLKEQEVDLLVSDFMMPQRSGIDLLTDVKQQYPQIIRILLTAYIDNAQTTKALSEGHAQQIVPKPWIDQEFKEIIRSALRQSEQQKKHSLEFQRLLNSIPLLPALPESYSQVQSCITDDDVDIEKMANIISQDVGMASLLLRWANSALFGQRYHVDTIKKAIVVLGTEIVTNLILSESISKSLAAAGSIAAGFDMKKFRSHSIATAAIARLLIKSVYSNDADLQDRSFIAALLHDIGWLIEANYFNKQYQQVVAKNQQEGINYLAAEREVLATDHCELGSFLTEWWALPYFISSAIAMHHEPKSSPVDPEIVQAVYLANQLAYRFGYGCNDVPAGPEIEQTLQDKFFLNEEGLEILQVETEKIVEAFSN
ncbi:HD-like signal output (HDOD) domain, no enzymatic activity [Malonomonas rubra DSM 5091]|uniref:HD-like signal output (HDOD) domain, no enzymatic activity n=1 Tax=Malonomonas rubra DSM 5091 TaxID=1122189 RepID=A0A1M6DVR1_MALRU|nr:response regulator [Malonomonas rubra]SHI77344.1 HD-like signal output (HDOD) domain, no enzymatic activity [Malonomonas rubra DSM 5091]